VKITATTHDTSSAMLTTANNVKQYSPAPLLANPTGRNPATDTSVPVSIGNAVDVYANVAARNLSQPSSIFFTIISTAIIASSTSRPSAMISAPSEMRCRLISKISMNTNVIASTSGMLTATTRPARMPRLTKLTMSTMPMASNRPR
jgi:hypothetical protein